MKHARVYTCAELESARKGDHSREVVEESVVDFGDDLGKSSQVRLPENNDHDGEDRGEQLSDVTDRNGGFAQRQQRSD